MPMKQAFLQTIADRIKKTGIIAVLIIDRVEDGVPLAKALIQGGVDVMELTLRTDAALGALKEIRAHVPEMLAGVGTVLTPAQVAAVKAAGAEFAVSPGINPRVVNAAVEAGIPFGPGVATPTDIENALECGCTLLKFFPAEPSGGLAFLKAMAAPYLHLGVQFIPLGGVNEKNMGTYLADPLIAAIGGSWLAPRELIREGRWAEITQLAKSAVEIIKSTRNS
jgi:2-dehydro-3-deoxyphosphogluconate aldolase/(4S)-4-hydroxy-2-oxoglutarate aldolase